MATTLPGSPSSAASRGESARCRAAHADGLRHDEDATSSEDAAEERTSIIRAPSWQLQGAKSTEEVAPKIAISRRRKTRINSAVVITRGVI